MQATRQQAIELLNAFTPNMGKRYESGRNYDNGPGRHHAVSMLSPYVSRRLITEQELVGAAMNAHGPDKAFKFIEEVFCALHFKGWLELRPSIWSDYVVGLEGDLTVLEKDKRLRAAIALPWMERLALSALMHGPLNSAKPDIFTIMRVCGLRRFGFLP